MNIKKLAVCILVVVAAAAFFLWIWIREENKGSQPQVCVRNDCFNVEIAKTESERGKGLMFRKSLSENSGMLFVFESPGIYPFWMKNTLIPLDMVWIGDNKEIVYIHKNAQPCTSSICKNINPETEAKYVFEINAGAADKSGILIGDKLKFINI